VTKNLGVAAAERDGVRVDPHVRAATGNLPETAASLLSHVRPRAAASSLLPELVVPWLLTDATAAMLAFE
jgi:hypothetical protein